MGYRILVFDLFFFKKQGRPQQSWSWMQCSDQKANIKQDRWKFMARVCYQITYCNEQKTILVLAWRPLRSCWGFRGSNCEHLSSAQAPVLRLLRTSKARDFLLLRFPTVRPTEPRGANNSVGQKLCPSWKEATEMNQGVLVSMTNLQHSLMWKKHSFRSKFVMISFFSFATLIPQIFSQNISRKGGIGTRLFLEKWRILRVKYGQSFHLGDVAFPSHLKSPPPCDFRGFYITTVYQSPIFHGFTITPYNILWRYGGFLKLWWVPQILIVSSIFIRCSTDFPFKNHPFWIPSGKLT